MLINRARSLLLRGFRTVVPFSMFRGLAFWLKDHRHRPTVLRKPLLSLCRSEPVQLEQA